MQFNMPCQFVACQSDLTCFSKYSKKSLKNVVVVVVMWINLVWILIPRFIHIDFLNLVVILV